MKKVFSLLFLVVTMHVYGQSIPEGYIDTVRWKYDKNKKELTVDRKDFKAKLFTFKIKIKNDSLRLDPKAMDSLLQVINRFSAGKSVSKSTLLYTLQDTTAQGFFTFPGEGERVEWPPIGLSIEELKRQVVALEERIQYYNFGISGLLLLILVLFLWGLMMTKSKRKILYKQQQEMTAELVGLMDKYFEKGKLHDESKNICPEDILADLAAKQKALKENQLLLEKSLSEVKNQLSDREEKLNEYKQINENHSKELKEQEEKIKGLQASEKERIISLCEKMIERKDLFLNRLSGLDEDLSSKELVRFSIAYAEMAVAVLDEIRGKNSETGKMNIRLLNGDKEAYGKIFDQHTSENAVDRESILIAKLLSRNGIESIDDVYFNGNKFQQKK